MLLAKVVHDDPKRPSNHPLRNLESGLPQAGRARCGLAYRTTARISIRSSCDARFGTLHAMVSQTSSLSPRPPTHLGTGRGTTAPTETCDQERALHRPTPRTPELGNNA